MSDIFAYTTRIRELEAELDQARKVAHAVEVERQDAVAERDRLEATAGRFMQERDAAVDHLDRLQEEVLGLRGADIPVLKREVDRLRKALERVANALDFHCAEDDDAVTAIARQALEGTSDE